MGFSNIDGIVAVAHTEGGHDNPNNTDPVLRTLAGFITHPNVGAVLCVDYGREPVNNTLLRDYLAENGYLLDAVPHAYLTLEGGFQAGLGQGRSDRAGLAGGGKRNAAHASASLRTEIGAPMPEAPTPFPASPAILSLLG